jgi:hypothetical protein
MDKRVRNSEDRELAVDDARAGRLAAIHPVDLGLRAVGRRLD